MKSMIFAGRNIKELLRDPLSWIFCLGFPIVMLVIMTVINNSIPAEANMTLFRLENLAPGIAVFGQTFIMLFACLLISGDRGDAFLLRVFTSPMKSSDYIIGYICPLILLAVGQYVITAAFSLVMAATSDVQLDLLNMLAALIFSLPSAVMFIGFGIIFGTLFSKNAAPGLSSIIITFSGMLGGIWMDIEAIGGVLGDICNALPFYHAVKCVRYAFLGNFAEGLAEAGIVLVWALILIVISVPAFKKKMKF